MWWPLACDSNLTKASKWTKGKKKDEEEKQIHVMNEKQEKKKEKRIVFSFAFVYSFFSICFFFFLFFFNFQKKKKTMLVERHSRLSGNKMIMFLSLFFPIITSSDIKLAKKWGGETIYIPNTRGRKGLT